MTNSTDTLDPALDRPSDQGQPRRDAATTGPTPASPTYPANTGQDDPANLAPCTTHCPVDKAYPGQPTTQQACPTEHSPRHDQVHDPTHSPVPAAESAAHAPPPPRVVRELRRPRLLPGLPVLHRAPGELQLGTDARHAVVLTGIHEPLVTLLRTLDGRDTAAELAARAGPENRAALDQLLFDLAGLGLVEDALPPEVGIDGAPAAGVPARLAADSSWWALRTTQDRVDANTRRQRATMVIYGGGRVAASLATLLAAAGVGWIHSIADGTVTPEEVGCGYLEEDVGRPRAAALRRAVLRGAPRTNTQPLPRQRKPDLVLLTDTVVPDPQLAKELFVTGAMQLLAWAGEGVGVVGPLIVPGRSCCLRCVDLHKTDAEPAWPALAAQLAGRPQQADLASAQATAAFAVSQALRVLDGPRIGGLPWHGISELPVWGTAIEIDTFSGQTNPASWQPHPRCACGRKGGR